MEDGATACENTLVEDSMTGILRTASVWGVAVVLLVVSVTAFGSGKGDEYAGGIVWNNYTKTFAGGSGSLPVGVESADFIRCKACHGWDAQGVNGGYARRSGYPERDNRPRPSSGADLISRLSRIDAAMVLAEGGRALSDANNDHPDYSLPGGLTETQLEDVVAFLNRGPKIGDVATLDVTANPVRYAFINPDIEAGGALYVQNCSGCHGLSGKKEDIGRDDGVIEYFRADGKYSEGFHKIIYGADEEMTRRTSGDLSAEQARDILAWIQTKADDESLSSLD